MKNTYKIKNIQNLLQKLILIKRLKTFFSIQNKYKLDRDSTMFEMRYFCSTYQKLFIFSFERFYFVYFL